MGRHRGCRHRREEGQGACPRCKRPRRRLYTRIYVSILGVLLVVGLAAGGMFSLMFRTHTWRNPAERLVRRAAAQFAEPLGEDDRGRLLERARHLAEEFDIDLTVRDLDGRRLVAVGAELPPLGRADAQAVRRGPIHVTQRYGHWFVAAPIADRRSGEALGVLEISLMRRLPVPSPLRPVAMLALVLAVVALLTWPLARRISRPVERLTDANRRLGGGDLGYRIPLPCHGPEEAAGDELMELSRSWNEMAERIEGLMRGQRELLANVSHELRSPLTRIRVALALVPEAAGPEVARRMADIETDLGELERLIDEVLTTARLEAAGLPMRPGRVEVAPLLALLAERAEGVLGPAGDGPRVVVEADPELVVMADGALLKRAVWNLVENAMKYGAPPIVLRAGPAGAGVALSVSDAGPGISSAERQRVLEPFYRADKARTPSPAGGFGLGLTLARRIAELHGGAIQVEPAEVRDGQEIGCRITLTIPA